METKNIEFWLKKLCLNQKQLAEKLEVTEQSVINWKKSGKIPAKNAAQLELLLLKNAQTTTNGTNVTGDKNNVTHETHDSHNIYYGHKPETEKIDGALCKFNENQFSQIIDLINKLNSHCSVKDAQIQFCTEQITKLIRERDELQKQLIEIYRTGKINRD